MLLKVIIQGTLKSFVPRTRKVHSQYPLINYLNIETEMKDVPLKCKNVGCVAHLPMANDELMKHEKFCPHREVPCPASLKNSCNWRGPLSNLIKHMKDKKCVQVIFDDNWKEDTNAVDFVATSPIFKSNLGDFPSSTQSVFERSTVLTHWKPVVLLAKGTS